MSVKYNPFINNFDYTGSGGGGGGVTGTPPTTISAMARWSDVGATTLEDSLLLMDDEGNISVTSAAPAIVHSIRNTESDGTLTVELLVNLLTDSFAQIDMGFTALGLGGEIISHQFGMNLSSFTSMNIACTGGPIYMTGGLARPNTTRSGSVSIPNDTYQNFCNPPGGGITLTIDDATAFDGQSYKFIDTSGAASSNNITIAISGGGTINGVPNAVISTNYGYVEVTKFDVGLYVITDEG